MKCCHTLVDRLAQDWARHNNKAPVCEFDAKYEISDKLYCKKHAQIVALTVLVEAKQAHEVV